MASGPISYQNVREVGPSVTWVEFFVASRRCPPQNQHFQIPIRSGNSGQREQTCEMSIGKFSLFPFDL